MQTAILTLHVIVCLVLVVLVLLQAGREGMGVIFGGSGNSSVFGSAGAGGVLVKLTAFLAVLFIITSMSYNIMTNSGRQKESSVLDVQFEDVAPPAQTAPATPPAAPAEQPAAPAETPAPQQTPTDAPAQPAPAEAPAPQPAPAETPTPPAS